MRNAGAVAVGLVILMLAGEQGRAALIEDPNEWHGVKTFQTTLNAVIADIEYHVYAPGEFDPNLDPTGGQRYIYTYQIFNNVGDSGYTGYVHRFSLGLQNDEQVANMGYIDDPNGVDPNDFGLGHLTVGWNFVTPTLDAGNVSDVLLFSSPFLPEWDTATISGSYALADTHNLPSPSNVPEPATIVLLCGGAALMLRKRKRRRFE